MLEAFLRYQSDCILCIAAEFDVSFLDSNEVRIIRLPGAVVAVNDGTYFGEHRHVGMAADDDIESSFLCISDGPAFYRLAVSS